MCCLRPVRCARRSVRRALGELLRQCQPEAGALVLFCGARVQLLELDESLSISSAAMPRPVSSTSMRNKAEPSGMIRIVDSPPAGREFDGIG